MKQANRTITHVAIVLLAIIATMAVVRQSRSQDTGDNDIFLPLLESAAGSATPTPESTPMPSPTPTSTPEATPPVDEGETIRVSVASDGTEANGPSWQPSISADGKVVAFTSFATNLIDGDTNGVTDVFIHNIPDRTTSLISKASDGSAGNGHSLGPSISADGNFVAFSSDATNLVNGDANDVADIFLHDRVAGTTVRVSVASDGEEGNGASYFPSVSANGRYVAFQSDATNLASGDTNGFPDIYLHDTETATTILVSRAPNGDAGDGPSGSPAIAGNGSAVVYESDADNLVEADTNPNNLANNLLEPNTSHNRQVIRTEIYSRTVGDTEWVSEVDGILANGYSFGASISEDGDKVGFLSTADNLISDDTNGATDAFTTPLRSDEIIRTSVDENGNQLDGMTWESVISPDGDWAAFSREKQGQDEVFIVNIPSLETSDPFVVRVSEAPDGSQADGHSYNPALGVAMIFNEDGVEVPVVFTSEATNLGGNIEDTNGVEDVYYKEIFFWGPNPPPPP